MDPRSQTPGPADIPPPSTPAWHVAEPAATSAQARLESPVPAIVIAAVGIVAAVVVALAVGARGGALVIAAMLAVAAVWRSTSSVGPAGLAVRSRGFDVLLYGSGAATIAVLALTAPAIS